ncbi:MAG: lipid-A-disaccharide synthase [Leptolyngbya sp. SIO4C1]|nr:lipid-A-disaccharide synthase [Leptolyngbya sp. SIO4C1]
MPTDILILTNAPGEVTTWVKPVVKALRDRTAPGDIRISVMLSPCPHASGGEAESLRSYPEVDRVQEPAHFFRFLLTGKTAASWDWHRRGAVVFLGGDQFYAVVAAKRLGYRCVVYAEWEARWASQVDRFGVMQASVIDGLKPQYRHKATVVGDLMADVQFSEQTAKIQAQLALMPETELLGMLPGSKGMKAKAGVPLVLAIADYLYPLRSQLRFVVPVAPTLDIATLVSYADPAQNSMTALMQSPPAKLVQPDAGLPYLQTPAGAKVYLWTAFPALDLLAQCRLCLTTVGANTAQLGALGIPMIVLLPTQQLDAMRSWDGLPGLLAQLPVIGTPISKLTNRVMLHFIQQQGRRFAWPNIWAEREVVPELLGHLTAESIGQHVIDLLEQPQTLSNMRDQLRRLRGPSGAATRMAEIILDAVDYPYRDIAQHYGSPVSVPPNSHS